MHCPNCGTKVNEKDDYCYKCGYKLRLGKSKKTRKFSKNVKKDRTKSYRKHKLRINCTIQGMDKNFKPNGSYDTIDLGDITLDDALDIVRKLPDKDDFPPHLLRELKKGYDVCPPAVILTYGEYTLDIFSEGEKGYLYVVADGIPELAGLDFRQKDPVTLETHTVKRKEAEEIVKDFYRKVGQMKALGLALSPLDFSVLMAIKHGISKSEVIAKLTGKTVHEVESAINSLDNRDLIKVRKKGLLRRKKYYEITPKGEKILSDDKKKLRRVIKEERDLMDSFAVAFWIMYALHDLPDGVSSSDIVDSVGEPPERIDAIHDSDISYDGGGEFGGDSGGDHDGDWGDGDADGAW